MSDIAKVRIEKGKVSVWLKDGTMHQMRIKELRRCMVDPCLLCSNLTCLFSDISCGSLGSEEGWTTLIVRTEKGMKLLDEAVKEGYLEISDEVDLDGVRRTVSSKNTKRDALVEERTEKGLHVPLFE
jgi:coenzyme F420 hydrogenase subunit beta